MARVDIKKDERNRKARKKPLDLFPTTVNISKLVLRKPGKLVKGSKILLLRGPKGLMRYLVTKKIVVKQDPTLTHSIIEQIFALVTAASRDPRRVYKALRILVLRGPVEFYSVLALKRQVVLRTLSLNQQYKIWFENHYPIQSELNKQIKDSKRFPLKPKISILVPTYNTKKKALEQALNSVLAQSYPNWELCLADDASSSPDVGKIIKNFAKKDRRVKYVFRQENGHISAASNTALGLATGDFVALLDHDDFLWPSALFEVVKALNEFPEADFFYSDEDKIDEDGRTHVDPFFKPDWSPDYLRAVNYITHFSVIRKTLVDKIGGFRLGFEGAQDWDLFLRATREIQEENQGKWNQISNTNGKIIHIPTVLYSWCKSPTSTASGRSFVKNYAFKIQEKVLEDDLRARSLLGEILETPYLGIWQTKYRLQDDPLVSIIIPTKEKFSFISKCLRSVLDKTTYKNFELVVVDTGSTEKRIFELYEQVKREHPNFQMLKWAGKFNFSSVCNLGAEKAKGKYLVFLNNDTEVITPDWIEAMLEHAQRPEIGAVGAKLLYPDNKIQHAGVILGIRGGVARRGVAGHAFKRFRNADQGEHFQAIHSIRNYSAVTAACLMISKEKYLAVGGQDSIFRIAFNDVDFCLKLLKKGWFNVYTPYAVLYHHESVSVGTPASGVRDVKEFLVEMKLMNGRWGELLDNDPFYNKNLTLDREDFSLRI